MKNFAQDGRRLPLNPTVWYRGWTAGVLMCVPMTVVQFGAARRLERLFETKYPHADDASAFGTTTNQTNANTLSPGARFLAAGLAGGVSGLCVQPLDVLMTQQQKFGGSLVDTARRMREMSRANANANANANENKTRRRSRASWPFTRGVRLVVAREAFYSCGYLGAVPLLREARPDLPFAACAIACGMGAAVLTQPLDTVKTVMQSNLTRQTGSAARGVPEIPKSTGGEGAAKLGGLGYRDTAAALVREGGVLSLWRGLAPRGARVVGATLILSLVNERAGEAVAGWREGER